MYADRDPAIQSGLDFGGHNRAVARIAASTPNVRCAAKKGTGRSPSKLPDRKPSRRSFPVFPGRHFWTWKSPGFVVIFGKRGILPEILDQLLDLPEKVDLAGYFWRFSACQNLCLSGRDPCGLKRSWQGEN